MPTLQAIISVALAGFALSATPGPSMLYVLSRSVGQSRAAGIASAIGLCLGGVLLAVATALGLATVFHRFDWLVVALRYLGSAYLAWLGVGMILSARRDAQKDLKTSGVVARPLLSIMWQGVLVELMNPKTVLFFALFLPPFVVIEAQGGTDYSVTLQLLVLGALVPLTAIPSDIVVALLGGTIKDKVNRNRRAREAMAWAGGLILIAIAISLHLH